MAVLQGISGLSWGDGSGGQVALSITTQVLRILSNDKLSYLIATTNNPSKAGTNTYYVPEIIASGEYGTAGEGVSFADPETGIVSINIDRRRQNKWEVETFDISRLNESGYLMGVIAAGIAKAISADLNAEYLTFLVKQFKSGGSLQSQVLELDYIGKKNTAMSPENSRIDYNAIQYLITELEQTFDKKMVGVDANEIFGILSLKADIGIRNAFWNQPNTLGEFVIKETLQGTKLGLLKYFTDVMLDKQISAGSSFTDQEVNTTNLIGLIIHKEAVGMPININQTIQTINPENGNIRFITKYQFGIGVLRPKLCWALKNKGQALPTSEKQGLFTKKAS